MQQQPKYPNLPIHSHRQQITTTISNSAITIICGQTGSGKTTQVPQYLYPHYGSILITQPRRISAITLAERVAQEMGYKIGQEIGYSVRFQEKRSEKSKVMFMTDGMAIRELMIGKMFDVFVIDQAHERSINTDVLLALLKSKMKRVQQYNKEMQKVNNKNNNKNNNNSSSSKSLQKYKNNKIKDFKIIIMSATIQSNKFMQFFQTNSLIKIKGRTYPTQIYHTIQPIQNYLQQCYNTILQIHVKQPAGDILVFLTGEDQILSLSKRLQQTLTECSVNNLEVLMLYSALPHEHQHSIFTPAVENLSGERRRVILATNIAETSITISGLKYVVDTGFMKIRVYDSIRNIQMLAVVPIAKANALQRAGRAGRQRQGKCYRLYIKGDYDVLNQQTVPQILRSQLSGPILQLKAIGIPKISQLQFMDQPPKQTIQSCLTLLKNLKCLTTLQTITPYGLQISKIPLPPSLAHLLIQSHQQKCTRVMLSVLAVLSIDNLFYIGGGNNNNNNKNSCILDVMKKYVPIVMGVPLQSDHLAKANIIQQYVRSVNKKAFCKGNHINKNNIKRAVMIREQLQEYLTQILKQRSKKQFSSITQSKPQLQAQPTKTQKYMKYSHEQLTNWLKCMQNSSPNNIAKLNKEGNSYTITSSGQIASIHPESLLFFNKNKPQLIVFYQVVKTSKLYLRDVTGLLSSK